ILNPRQSPVSLSTRKTNPKRRLRVPQVCRISVLGDKNGSQDWTDNSPRIQHMAGLQLHRSQSGNLETKIHHYVHVFTNEAAILAKSLSQNGRFEIGRAHV